MSSTDTTNDLEIEALRKATGNMDPDATLTDLRREFYEGIIDGTITVNKTVV